MHKLNTPSSPDCGCRCHANVEDEQPHVCAYCYAEHVFGTVAYPQTSRP
jgi:hypothetical protein